MGISKQSSGIITTNEERSICVQTDIERVPRNVSVNENQDKLLNLQIKNTRRAINDRILFNKKYMEEINFKRKEGKELREVLEKEKLTQEHKKKLETWSIEKLAGVINWYGNEKCIFPVLMSYEILKSKLLMDIDKDVSNRELKIRKDLLEYIQKNDYKVSSDAECYIFNKKYLAFGKIRKDKYYIKFTGRKFVFSSNDSIYFSTYSHNKNYAGALEKHLSRSSCIIK